MSEEKYKRCPRCKAQVNWDKNLQYCWECGYDKGVEETYSYCKPCGGVDLTVRKQIGYLKICVCKSCGRVYAFYDKMMEFIDKMNEMRKKPEDDLRWEKTKK